MATATFYLDCRSKSVSGVYPLKLAIRAHGSVAYLATGIYLLPHQWCAPAMVVVRHPHARPLSAQLARLKDDVDLVFQDLARKNVLQQMTVQELREKVARVLNPDAYASNDDRFVGRFIRFMEMKKPSTRALYRCTLSRMRAYCPEVDAMRFEQVNREWLTGFDLFLSQTSPSKNARNLHLRNIRAVFNYAIDEEVTHAYPFRRFKIRPVATRKRSLSVERLRELFAAEVEPYAVQYLDMFKLTFMLCGINKADLCALKEIVDGRVEYYRAKTGRFYSVKVEPEALEIINRYRGCGQLLDMMDRYKSSTYFGQHLNRALQRIGAVERRGRGGKKYFEPLCPGITTYWARHSWATIAASLDIPKETIAAGLGHGGNTVTDIYIDFDRRKVDEANRRVLDWVLYGKR